VRACLWNDQRKLVEAMISRQKQLEKDIKVAKRLSNSGGGVEGSSTTRSSTRNSMRASAGDVPS
jgi:hypothetical protein